MPIQQRERKLLNSLDHAFIVISWTILKKLRLDIHVIQYIDSRQRFFQETNNVITVMTDKTKQDKTREGIGRGRGKRCGCTIDAKKTNLNYCTSLSCPTLRPHSPEETSVWLAALSIGPDQKTDARTG